VPFSLRCGMTLATLLTLSLAGCAGSKFHPVRGRVHYADGSPLIAGRVVADLGGPAGSWGIVRPDGRFVMGTRADDDGVPAGKFRVCIENAVTPPPASLSDAYVAKPLVHARFTKFETSGLEFEVPRQAEWDIVVEKP
jgi:hypothetical protein